jgi:adenine-specific DNA-methyltransferase
VIFVSIDDNEQANLKLLMDDIFGESNFVGLMTIQSNPRGSQSSKNLSNVHEYVLMYAKNESVMEIKGVSKEEESVTEYLEKEKDGRLFRYLGLRQRGGAWRKEQRPKMHYPIYVNPQNGQVSLMKNEIYKIEVIPQRPTGELGRWTWGKDKLEKNKKLVIGKQKKRTGQQETWDIFRKDYFLDDAGNKKYEKIKTIWIEKETNYQNAKNEMRELFLNSEIFDFPKPTYIIKTLIMMFFSSHDDIILDFFAGSATTAHAVMQLNAEDGGNRKFIIVQLDEETNPDSEARKAGYKTIDEIARARISLAGKKILADYESDLAKQSNGWDKDIGFKHYRLITPDIKTIEKITEFNSEETNLIADDMIKPFEYKDTNTKGLDTILTTWLIDDGYRFDTNAEEIVFGKYAAHYVREAATLYLINRDWDTKALIPLLNQIGKNQLLVKTIVVYPYSFTFEAMRELKTNIKTNLAPSPILIERF